MKHDHRRARQPSGLRPKPRFRGLPRRSRPPGRWSPRPTRRAAALVFALAAAAALALVAAGSSAPSAACSFCGKNLIKNPGAELGRGLNAPGELGAVPGWTNTAGQFSAAAYTGFGIGWFSATSKGPKDKGKNYFFGGTTTAATSAQRPSAHRRSRFRRPRPVTRPRLSGWLGNYSADTTQVRAEFMDASGKVLSAIRIGPDTTIGGEDMALRSRNGTVPHGNGERHVVVTFTDHANYNLAGADDLSLVLS